MRKITKQILEAFCNKLNDEEKSHATIEKYVRDINEFSKWLSDRSFDKRDVLEYKSMIIERYAVSSVNSMLSSLNSLFAFCGWYELKVKTLKTQRQMFSSDEKEIGRAHV